MAAYVLEFIICTIEANECVSLLWLQLRTLCDKSQIELTN